MAAADFVWSLIQTMDETITTTEPFKLVKHDKPAAQAIIAKLVQDLDQVGRLLAPLLPTTSHIIQTAVTTNQKPDNLFTRLEG